MPPYRSHIAVAAAAFLAAAAPVSAAGLSGSVVGARPPGAQASVRLIDPRTGVITAVAAVGRRGTWTARVSPGPYIVTTSIVRPDGSALRGVVSELVRVRPGARARVRLSPRRPRPRRPTGPRPRARQAEAGAALPVIAVKNLVPTGPHPQVGAGLSQMIVTRVVTGAPGCAPAVVEWERRAEVRREIDLRNSRYADPADRIRARWLAPGVFVQGTVDTTGGGARWSIRLADAETGEVVGGDDGEVPETGDLLDVADDIGTRLLEQICGTRYEVGVHLVSVGDFPTHTATGTIDVTFPATGVRGPRHRPPTTFTGSAPIRYLDLSFSSRIACAFTGPASTDGNLAVTLDVLPDGRLRVTWTPTLISATATVVCPDGAVPGQPGPLLLRPTPATFEVPATGGRQAVAGGVADARGGLSHTGAITVRRIR